MASLLVATASACDSARVCPVTPAEAEAGSFSGLGEDSVVFTGYAIRYVDAPDPELRGYDLNVVRWLKGSASPEGTFLRVEREVPGILGGQPVMIIGEPVGRGVVIEPGICVPLIPIPEDAVQGR